VRQVFGEVLGEAGSPARVTATAIRTKVRKLLPGREIRKPTAASLRDALAPLRSYLKNWDQERLYGVTPPEARRLLKQVQEIDAVLLEVERALEARTVRPRALR